MILIHTYFVPGEAPSTPNLREHWAHRAERTKKAKAKTRLAGRWKDGPLLTIRLTRVGTRLLDDDNLAGALKAHRDGVAATLRIDDASPLARWQYHQETDSDATRHGVHVEFMVTEPWAHG